MSENDRLAFLFLLTVGFGSLVLLPDISVAGCLVGAMGAFIIAMFWLHLWCLEKGK